MPHASDLRSDLSDQRRPVRLPAPSLAYAQKRPQLRSFQWLTSLFSGYLGGGLDASAVPLPPRSRGDTMAFAAPATSRRETYPLCPVSNRMRADIGFGIRRRPNPVARRSQNGIGGVARARRPGSTVLKWNLPAGWLEQFNRAGKAGSVRMG